MADVKALLTQYSKRGISVGEVKKLKEAVIIDGSGPFPRVDKTELKQLKEGLTQFADKFSPASQTEYERFVGQFGVQGEHVVIKFRPFNDLWRIDDQAAFRKLWGITNKNDPKAPTFEQNTNLSDLPEGLQQEFERFARSYLNREEVEVVGAERIFDRHRNHIGYAVISDYDGFTGYYRLDGTPAGLSRNPPVS